ncbi:FAD:protein FMN transferase [Solirhodobacter olei]|uniref:FAD:protein FMN transferase n=1 Tax=Solirhodobacter olei TaxID=2493082 RepID=UPI000FD8681E|nr:FAD:protein FMN transferase [Solirhodobacter olei]
MQPRITRRRALFIAAAACALPKLAAAAPVARWQGNALGAHAEIRLAGLTYAEAEPTFARVEAELDRLESLFSLYRADSVLMSLNAEGRLDRPPLDMLELLSLAGSVHDRTGGLFDPTVQPLFALYATLAVEGRLPSAEELAAAYALVGFDGVAISPDRIAFARPGMALTLNGIAQGFITDRITKVLREAGLRDMLVDIGEIRAIGNRPAAGGWEVRLSDGSRVVLNDRAIASSNRLGTLVNPAAGVGHIFDPLPGEAAPTGPALTVNAQHASAAVADAYATAATLATRDVACGWQANGLTFSWT